MSELWVAFIVFMVLGTISYIIGNVKKKESGIFYGALFYLLAAFLVVFIVLKAVTGG